MKIYELIKVLANVCRYNANGEVYIYVNGQKLPLQHCLDQFIDRDPDKRVILLTADPEYYGE